MIRRTFRCAAIALASFALVLLHCVGCSAPAPGVTGSTTEPFVAPRIGQTPEDTIHLFIQAQRDGDQDAARAQIWPDTNRYALAGPAVIQDYRLKSKRVLTKEEAAQFTEGAARLEGDVEILTWEEYEAGRTSEVTYYLRLIDGAWRIYALDFTI